MDRKPYLLDMLKETPEDPFLLFALAKEYEKSSNTQEALQLYERLYRQNPEYVGLYYHYGKLLQQTGECLHAREIFSRGIQISTAVKDFHSKSELESALEALEEYFG